MCFLSVVPTSSGAGKDYDRMVSFISTMLLSATLGPHSQETGLSNLGVVGTYCAERVFAK